MKNENIILVAMLGAAAWLVSKGMGAKTGTQSNLFGSVSNTLKNLNPLTLLNLGTTTWEQNNAAAGSIAAADPYMTGGYSGGNGWTYYNDGSAVDPEGNLWWQGQKVGSGGTISTYQSPNQLTAEIMPVADNGAVWI